MKPDKKKIKYFKFINSTNTSTCCINATVSVAINVTNKILTHCEPMSYV